ncbi:class I SAM-dependent methyltransferase [Acidobacteria bacterium AB60]|nr:class I SAM-dependent methyltransferase [Acidobacteria bacterium AB60]
MGEPDKSRGYEGIAPRYIAGRGSNSKGRGVGAIEVAEWSRGLPGGGSVLDVGCGTGLPISQVLIERGLEVFGVDASPSMVAAFRRNFPDAPVECAAAEDSTFFGRSFDGIVSWGLFFLLDEGTQRRLLSKVAGALKPGGSFCFTAPQPICSWNDAMTQQLSLSLGYEAYKEAMAADGLELTGTLLSAGDNFYYFARKLKQD